MTVFFLIYFTTSLLLLCALEFYRFIQVENLTDDERHVFGFMESKPIPFYVIFVLISPILAIYTLLQGIATYFSEVNGK